MNSIGEMSIPLNKEKGHEGFMNPIFYICNLAKRMSIQEISFAHAVAIVSW
jgi:hypothetical protein